MALITWNKDWCVEVSEIDSQHKELVGYINDLNDAMLAGHGEDVIGGILNGLISYTVMHFGSEEQYFTEFAYVEATAHKQEHDDFVKEIMDYKHNFEIGGKSVAGDLLMFLYGWLLNHIKDSDKKYVPCFIHNGLH